MPVLLKNHKIDFENSPILRGYFEDFQQDAKLYFETTSLTISTIKELENYLELIIPESDRKVNGAFFTPDFVIDFIINEIKPQLNDKNLDPSCGCGAFLIGLVSPRSTSSVALSPGVMCSFMYNSAVCA